MVVVRGIHAQIPLTILFATVSGCQRHAIIPCTVSLQLQSTLCASTL